ncbi:MAG: carboxypeptidase-like regulatory domain-containing protein, partial [Planctomycetota bacterium]
MGIIGLVGVMAFFLLSSPEQGEGFSDLRVEARDEPSITPDTAAEDAVEDRVPLESDLPEGRLSLSGRLTLNANLLPDIMIQAIPDAVEPLPASLREMLKFSPLVDESPDNELRKMLDTESREAETTIIECESGPHGEFTLQVPKSETLSFRLDHDFYYLPKEQAGPLAWDLEGDLPELIGYESRLEARLGALILGEVVDNEGLPVSGAGVEIEQETGTRGMDSAFASMMGAGRMRAQTVTTDQGFFSLRAVEPGTGLILRAECEGLVAAKSEIFDAAPGQTVRIQVRLGEGSTLKARVRGPEDEPLVNAQVFLHRERERESDATRGFMRMGGSRIVDSGKTDEKGSVLFTALGPGEYSVSAAYPGMCELSESSEAIVIRKVIRAYETTVDLAWGEVIAGTIMDDAGTPVEGARVVARIHIDMQGGGMRSMMRGAFTSPDRVSNEAMSQAGGGFRITGLEPDAVYDLITEQSGFTPSSESGIESGRKDLKIVLERMGQIEGTVLVRLSQTPVESFKIRIAPKDPGDDGRADFRGRGRDTGDTDRDGNQRGRNPGNRPDRGMIFGGRGAGPEMGSSSMSRLFETMRNSMTARFASPSRFTDKEEEFVDSEGRFSLKEIIPGEYVLCVSAKGCAPLISEPIVVEKNSTVRNVAIRLGPGASVSGRVEGLHGPVPKVRIRINADDDQTGSVESMDMLLETVDSCRTLKDGSFVITGLPEGRFILQADHPDYPDTRSDPFPLREGQVLGGLVIPLPMGGR